MTGNEVQQIGNSAGNDIVGRDKYDNRTTIHNYPSGLRVPALTSFYERYKDDVANNRELKENIEKFNYYTTPFKGDVIGLEAKLQNGGFGDIIEYAQEAKESFHKQLYRNQFSESAQLINCHLLSIVQSYFETYIMPKIRSGMQQEEVIVLVQERIVTPLLHELGENILNLMAIDIQGMVYFLTGNCHIKWER